MCIKKTLKLIWLWLCGDDPQWCLRLYEPALFSNTQQDFIIQSSIHMNDIRFVTQRCISLLTEMPQKAKRFWRKGKINICDNIRSLIDHLWFIVIPFILEALSESTDPPQPPWGSASPQTLGLCQLSPRLLCDAPPSIMLIFSFVFLPPHSGLLLWLSHQVWRRLSTQPFGPWLLTELLVSLISRACILHRGISSTRPGVYHVCHSCTLWLPSWGPCGQATPHSLRGVEEDFIRVLLHMGKE